MGCSRNAHDLQIDLFLQRPNVDYYGRRNVHLGWTTDQMIYFWSIFVSLIHSFIYLFYILLLSERLHINIFRNAILTSRNCCVCAIYAYAYRCILHVYIWLVKYLFDRFQHHCHAPSPLRVCQQHYTHSTRHSTVQHSTAKGLLFNY